MAKQYDKFFVNISLDRRDKDNLAAFIIEWEHDYLAMLEHLLLLGYKMSIVHKDDTNTYIVSAIGTEVTKHNSSKIMSSFSDNPGEAIAMAAYKILVMFPDLEWPGENNNSRWG